MSNKEGLETIGNNSTLKENESQSIEKDNDIPSWQEHQQSLEEKEKIKTDNADVVSQIYKMSGIEADDDKELDDFLNSKEMGTLADAGVKLREAKDAGILYDEVHIEDIQSGYGETHSSDGKTNQGYWKDLQESIPALAAYFSDDVPKQDKEIMKSIIEFCSNENNSAYDLPEDQVNLLKKHSDVIANRLFYGNTDLRHKVFA